MCLESYLQAKVQLLPPRVQSFIADEAPQPERCVVSPIRLTHTKNDENQKSRHRSVVFLWHLRASLSKRKAALQHRSHGRTKTRKAICQEKGKVKALHLAADEPPAPLPCAALCTEREGRRKREGERKSALCQEAGQPASAAAARCVCVIRRGVAAAARLGSLRSQSSTTSKTQALQGAQPCVMLHERRRAQETHQPLSCARRFRRALRAVLAKK